MSSPDTVFLGQIQSAVLFLTPGKKHRLTEGVIGWVRGAGLSHTLKGPWQFIMKGRNAQFCWHRVTGSSGKEVGLFHSEQTSQCSPFMFNYFSVVSMRDARASDITPAITEQQGGSPPKGASLHTRHLGSWGGTHTWARSWSSHMEPWDWVQLEIPNPV